MLLTRDDVRVSPNGYRPHDYVVVRLALQNIGEPTLTSTWFAQVTLGSVCFPSDQIMGQTSGFILASIKEHPDIYNRWKRICDSDKWEGSYPDFLLRVLMERTGLGLQFFIQDDRVSKFVVSLGAFELEGRLPQDVDILTLYFGVEMATSDD